jgi:hypothetical protein
MNVPAARALSAHRSSRMYALPNQSKQVPAEVLGAWKLRGIFLASSALVLIGHAASLTPY